MAGIILIEKPQKVSLTGSPIQFQFLASGLGGLSMFQVVVDVLVWNGSDYVLLSKEGGQIDENGLVDFNLQELFRDRIKKQFTYPESKYNLMLEHTNLSGKFKIQYNYQGWDEDNNKEVGTIATLDEEFYFLEGGQPDIIRQLQTEADTDWYQELVENKSFLTNQPTNKTIHPEQCEKLYWLVREGCTSLKLNLQVNLLDGTETSSQPLSIGVTPFNIVETTATLKHLVEDVSLVASYKIWLTDQANAIASEVFEYSLDHQWYERNDFLPFANSLGAFDTVWLHGQRADEVEAERKTYAKQMPGIRPRLEDKSFVSTRGLMARNNKSNTGFISPEYTEYLSAEFLGSDQVMCLVGDQLWPVFNLSDSAKPFDDKDELIKRSLDIEWQLGDKTRFYGTFNKEIKHPLPPQWNDIEACFMRLRNGKLIDIKGGKTALAYYTDKIVFPVLNKDVFRRNADSPYWTDLEWSGGDNTWPLAELTGTFTVLHSTQACRDLLFFKDIVGDNIRSCFPIIVYKTPRTFEQQKEIVAYMNEAFFLLDKTGALITEDGKLKTYKF